MSQATVYVIDDDQAVRESLAYLIGSVGLTAQTYSDAKTFLDACAACPTAPAGCVVVDLRLPGMSGLELQEALAERGLDLPVIVITGHGDVPAAVRAMKAGAIDFVEKPFDDQRLLDCIQEAIERDTRERESRKVHSEVRRRFERLTPRECQVMSMVVQGKLNKQIAAELGLSPKTVEVHRAHVMSKMEANSLAELVHMSMATGRREV